MQLALFSLLSIGGFYYLCRFFKLPQELPTTGPRAGGFSRGDLLAACFLAALLIVNTIESFGKKQAFTVHVIVASCILYLCFIVGIVSLLAVRNRNPIRLFGLKWSQWTRQLPLAFLALLCVYPIIILVQLIMQRIYGSDVAPQEILQFLINSPSIREKLLLIFLAVVMAPLAEETIFRGYIFGTIRQHLGRWPAILINSAVFAMIHGHVPALLGLFILAVFLTLIYEHTGSLWAPIILHAFFNSVTIIYSLYFSAPTL